MASITVSVPGKIYLLGEHAVVYGKPALLAAINKRVYATVSEARSSEHHIEAEDKQFVANILSLVSQHLKTESIPPLSVKVTSQLKKGYHLGSSAATAAAVIAGCLYFLKKIWNPELTNRLAFESEKVIHGNPSGADNTAVVFGGIIWFRKELTYLKSIWQLPVRRTKLLRNFYLLDTGKPEETTKDLVAAVGEGRENQPGIYERLFNRNEFETKKLAEALKKGDETEFMGAIKAGSRTLEKMGVVSTRVSVLIKQIEKIGGAAKILGGGGKKGAAGYLLAYHRDVKIINHFTGQRKITCENAILGEEGIRLEKG
ncbi:MAG: mevalonate kinase, mevalonate kinase [Candidatus Gottesmanbacteria bacterium GW2011_GWA2_43_14]|uniref:Mevalonate kinase, mevalonate kinase n=1 Tax=Candidatus Gottesmanbacteria bacterium GW2011_GWA2_43_14 TaxID=1618443 RepID=A0A0G1DJ38_9BACT|nr:MAG: mevalonate kinase, mevalonate kinase [Candidatus Gottesmanbacteria bacterium GW2011_GWA2_43_14]